MSSNSPLPQASGLKAFACRARWLAPTFGPSIHKTARKFTKVALAVLASNTTELGGRNFDCSYPMSIGLYSALALSKHPLVCFSGKSRLGV
jgi:hypothetical protein